METKTIGQENTDELISRLELRIKTLEKAIYHLFFITAIAFFLGVILGGLLK